MEFNELRKEILKTNPPFSIHEKIPRQLFIGLGWISLVLLIVFFNLSYSLPYTVKILSSLILGLAFSILNFFNHELLHGSMLKSKRWSKALSYPGFFILALSPELWIHWHNHLHHYHTNQPGGTDPDLAGDWSRLKHRKIGPWIVKSLPGSKHILAYLLMPIIFSLQCLNVTWIRSRERPDLYQSMNRKVMITETLAYYGLWLALIIYLNFSQFLFLFLIPLFIVNIVIINIVGLPHNMRPLSGKNLPFETTVSLMAPKVFDFLFMNFSHHVEHHFFPELNHQHLPWVRGYLLKKYPDQFARVDLFRAILLLHQTPRAYFDESHLFYPGTEQKINLRQLAKKEFFSENT